MNDQADTSKQFPILKFALLVAALPLLTACGAGIPLKPAKPVEEIAATCAPPPVEVVEETLILLADYAMGETPAELLEALQGQAESVGADVVVCAVAQAMGAKDRDVVRAAKLAMAMAEAIQAVDSE